MRIKHKFDNTILREYDIRGIVNKSLTELDAFMVGYFFGLTLKQKQKQSAKVVVSRDGRLSSKKLSDNLIEGLSKSGVKIIDIGLNPTPVLYYANIYFNACGSIQVTGSHNPKNYNGFKMVMFNKSFYGKNIYNLGKFAENGSDLIFTGEVENINIEDEYISRILKSFKNYEKGSLFDKKIIWDCGNGATGNILINLIKYLPGKHFVLFSEIDGNFPNHDPDPTKEENLSELKKNIIDLNADFGIAFDGDGDRISVMKKDGELIPGDILTSYLSLSINDKSKDIILDIKSSSVAKNIIEKLGFNVQIWKTGHSHIKSKMTEIGTLLAGEMSGHIFFSDEYYGYDDALYSSLRFLNLINEGHDLYSFLNDLDPYYATPELKIKCSEESKFQIIENISKKLKNEYQLNDLILIDGVRVNLNDGWYLIRASNTENALIVRVEGKTEEYKKQFVQEVKNLLYEENIIVNL